MKALEHYERPAMKPMAFFRHLVAYVSWSTLTSLMRFPLSPRSTTQEKYLFLEFPHGVFPMGQFLSSAIVHKITPGKLVVGAAADAVFAFPVIRQVLSWIGTFPAHSKNIHEVLSSGMNCTIIVGGIAEMYLMNSSTESIYFRKRLNSVKIAIKEGAHIVPGFFFGNTRLFEVIGGGRSDSWLSQVSRRIRASILFFYGRHFLPVPYRHPIHMVAGEIVRVQQNDNPSDEEAQKVLLEVIRSVERLYEEKRPPWESRPLVIV